MPTLSEEAFEEFKQISKKDGIVFKDENEARESAQRLLDLFDVLIRIDIRDRKRKAKLKEFPKGFPIDDSGTYNCCVCHGYITSTNGWYDQYGLKCLNCQKALDTHVIPPSVCTDKNSWYDSWDLKSKFGIHPSTAKKLIREGKLKARNLTIETGGVYFQVFLVKENPYLKNRLHTSS